MTKTKQITRERIRELVENAMETESKKHIFGNACDGCIETGIQLGIKEAYQREALAEARGRRELANEILAICFYSTNQPKPLRPKLDRIIDLCDKETAKAETDRGEVAPSAEGNAKGSEKSPLISLPAADIPNKDWCKDCRSWHKDMNLCNLRSDVEPSDCKRAREK